MSSRISLRRRGTARRGPIALLGLVVALTLGLTTALPTAADEISDTRGEAERIADQIEELQHESEALTEEYLDARLAREQLDERIAEAEERAELSGAELDALSDEVRDIAVEGFMAGGEVDESTLALVGATSAVEVGARRGYAQAVGNDSDDLVDEYRGIEEIARGDARTLEDLQSEAERVEAEAEEAKGATEESLAELEDLQAEVTGRLRTLVEAEQARRDAARQRAAQERAEAAVAEAAREAAREAAAAPTPVPEPEREPTPAPPASSTPPPDAPQPAGPPPAPTPPPAASGGAGAAIAAARSVLGVPYVWAGASPGGGFDCSGLTMWAWGHGGKSLPHSSKAQYAMSAKIPVSQLQPGDLVFYGSPISHVGLYIGGGEMIHAPHTGDVVKISSIHYWSALVGGGRI